MPDKQVNKESQIQVLTTVYGIKKGMQQVAQSMLKDKEPIEKIIKWTEFSKEELQEIIKG